MIRRFLEFLADPSRSMEAAEASGEDEVQLAAVALLIEAALMDEQFEDGERAKIAELIKARFELDDGEAARLIDVAQDEVRGSNQLFRYTRVVNQRFDQEERIELMEMLWQVAYADGALHDYEANLMRRLAGLIHITDRDSGAARKRALASLGLEA
ncbi:MAG: TerB family tellurite resistance protein [Kiloniellales bacterium]|nr:TerB family tellurite resistance protein [Kiloniellales bacterium]